MTLNLAFECPRAIVRVAPCDLPESVSAGANVSAALLSVGFGDAFPFPPRLQPPAASRTSSVRATPRTYQQYEGRQRRVPSPQGRAV
jgi:hypothetical protein